MDGREAQLYSINKISEQLRETIKKSTIDERIPVYVWYREIDTESIDRVAERKLGYTEDDIRAEEAKMPLLNESVFSLNTQEYEAIVKSYRDETREARDRIISMNNDFTDTRRSLAREAYISYNGRQSDIAGIDSEVIDYTSQYTPVVLAKLSPMEIDILEKKDNVVFLGLKSEDEPVPELAYALPAIDADYVRNTLGFDGYGTKIGLFESGRVGTHAEFASSRITRLDSNRPVSNHATFVARIIVGSKGVAPECRLFSNSHATSAEQGIEALISQGVSVINISLEIGSRGSGIHYTDFERWIDHIAFQHSITVVSSSGNNGLSSECTPPSLAYNVITVGAINPKNTIAKTDDLFCTYTSVENGGTAGCAKPDILAPGEMLGTGGTSFAAPMVTGVIAQMLEYKPSIATDPALIKAILTACTDRKLPTTSGGTSSEVFEGNITAQQGAGVINAKLAIQILSVGKYASGSMSTGTVTRTFSVPSGNTFIRYAVAWIRNNQATGSGHGTIAATAGIAANLKLDVYRPTGVLAASGNNVNSSVELVHYNVNSVFGTYSAKLTRIDSGTNTFRYAVAWY